ncbi:MAG: hypothetical protein GKS00_09475 [Alphaproteobacteria bacterium]|nr:hypothetical protein [Alphaproteobacteria bacterium]
MPEVQFEPFDHPATWKATDFKSKDDFAIDLSARHIDALEAEIAAYKKASGDHAGLSPESFPLTTIQEDVRAWREEVVHGRGLLMLRGMPVDRMDVDDLRLLFLGLGTHIGRPVSQSANGELVADVVNIGGKDRNERAYRSSRQLKLHTDRCDHIGMLCIRKAIKGGVSGYASALAIHNEILATRPDLLEPLYNGFHHHRFGEQPPGEPLVTPERIPTFSITDGVPNVICIRGYIDLAVEEGHVTLSDLEKEALDTFEAVADRDDIRLDLTIEPGEASFTNNCCVLHTRTAFEDHPEPAQRRHILRLWLREDDRPAAPGVIVHKGQGIMPREGKGTYYKPSEATAS